jgi:glycosyltransferase involved in cell wall biosynthesis
VKKPYRLSIAVPVYNEEKTIETILRKLTALPIENFEIIVIDDASKDRSYDIITEYFQKYKGIPHTIVSHSKNMGKGAGIKTALKTAEGEYFVIQDADLEYDPKDLVDLLKFAEKNKVKAVYGSRFLGDFKNMPKANYYANKFYNFLLRRLYDTRITDMHTCYKMVKTDLINELNMTADGFSYASELVSKLLHRGITIHEVPISFSGRTKKEGKKIGYLDGIKCTQELLVYRFKASRAQ